MQPEYSHIVDAAVQYAKVWSVVHRKTLLT